MCGIQVDALWAIEEAHVEGFIVSTIKRRLIKLTSHKMKKTEAFGSSIGFVHNSGTVLESSRNLVTRVEGGPMGPPDSSGQRNFGITSSTDFQQSFWYRRQDGKEVEVDLPAGRTVSLRPGHEVTLVWARVAGKNDAHLKDVLVAVVNHTMGETGHVHPKRSLAEAIDTTGTWRFIKGTVLWIGVIVVSAYLPVGRETAGDVARYVIFYLTPAYIVWRFYTSFAKYHRANKELGEALRQHIAGIRV